MKFKNNRFIVLISSLSIIFVMGCSGSGEISESDLTLNSDAPTSDLSPNPLIFPKLPSYQAMNTDVLIQAYCYWSKWNGQHGQWYNGIKGKVGEIKNAGFTVVLLPPPSKTIRSDVDEKGDPNSACGYMPMDYYDLGDYLQTNVRDGWPQNGSAIYNHTYSKTLYGNKAELISLINSFHASPRMDVLADIVINHRGAHNDYNGAQANWAGCSSGLAKWGPDARSYLAKDDDKDSGNPPYNNSQGYGYANDDGVEGSVYPDLAHKNPAVKTDITNWMKWLKNSIGFDGWRYDLVKGFAPVHIMDYNKSTSPKISIGEYWDYNEYTVNAWVSGTYTGTGVFDGLLKSMAFDFPLKGKLNEALRTNNFALLNDGVLSNGGSLVGLIGLYPEASVTFVENHDTYEARHLKDSSKNDYIKDGPDSDTNNYNERLMGYAYILTHPGVPCVFWADWNDSDTYGTNMKDHINSLISARKDRVYKFSRVYIAKAEQNLYAAYIGAAGTVAQVPAAAKLAVKIGPNYWYPSGTGWVSKTSGVNYEVWTRP